MVKQVGTDLTLSARDMSFLNNILSLPFLIVLALFEGLHNTTRTDFSVVSKLCFGSIGCVVIILSSCVGGFCVSLSGFRAQQVMSPTSWLTLNNISKIPAILLSPFFFGGELTGMSILGMSISLGAGYLYSLSRQHKVFPHVSQSWKTVMTGIGAVMLLSAVTSFFLEATSLRTMKSSPISHLMNISAFQAFRWVGSFEHQNKNWRGLLQQQYADNGDRASTTLWRGLSEQQHAGSGHRSSPEEFSSRRGSAFISNALQPYSGRRAPAAALQPVPGLRAIP